MNHPMKGASGPYGMKQFSHVTPGSPLPSLLVSGIPEVETQAKYAGPDLAWENVPSQVPSQ